MIWFVLATGLMAVWGMYALIARSSPRANAADATDLAGDDPAAQTSTPSLAATLGSWLRHWMRAHWRAIVRIGIPLAVLLLVGGGVVIWARVNHVTFQNIKPASWLIRDAGEEGPAQKAAMAELSHRLAAGKLSPQRTAEAAEVALGIQADLQRRWDDEWGDFINAARHRGQLAESLWSRYLAQSINISFAVRPVVRRGEVIPCRFTVRTQRLARNLRCKIDWDASTVEFDGQPIPPALRKNTVKTTGSSDEERRMSSTCHAISLGERWATFKDGPHHVVAILRWTLAPSDGPDAVPVFSGETRFESSLEVAAESRDTITISTDPEVGAALKKGITIQVGGDDEDLLVVRVEGHALPVGLGARPFLRAGAMEVRGNTPIDLAPGDGVPAIFAGHVAPELERVDVIFRPDLDVARRSVEVIEAWGEELVFKDVPIRRGHNHMRRTSRQATGQPPATAPQGW